MKVSGKVTLLREVQKLQANGARYLEINGYEPVTNGKQRIYYSLFSANQRQFEELLKLKVGDTVHFSAATISGMKSFVSGNEPGTILNVDLNQAEISVQILKPVTNTMPTQKKVEEKPQTQPVVKEKDFCFDKTQKEELDILSDDWDGYNFHLD